MIRVVLAGIGNEMRHDDGTGPFVAARAARVADYARADGRDTMITLTGPLVEPLDLLGNWDGADLAIVVDAVRSDAEPGRVTLDWLGPPSALASGRRPPRSTHGLGVTEVYCLAQQVGSAPLRVALVGVEGADFSPGPGLSASVAYGAARATDLVLQLLRQAQERATGTGTGTARDRGAGWAGAEAPPAFAPPEPNVNFCTSRCRRAPGLSR